MFTCLQCHQVDNPRAGHRFTISWDLMSDNKLCPSKHCSERSACDALRHCRLNIVSTINGLFSLFSILSQGYMKNLDYLPTFQHKFLCRRGFKCFFKKQNEIYQNRLKQTYTCTVKYMLVLVEQKKKILNFLCQGHKMYRSLYC